MVIRSATVEKVAAVVDLYRGYDQPPDPEVAFTELEKNFEAISKSGDVAIVANDGAIVGTYTMYLCPNPARAIRPFAAIENAIVAPRARWQGVGRALMLHAQESARDHNFYKAMLATGANCPENAKFYEACDVMDNKVVFQVCYGA